MKQRELLCVVFAIAAVLLTACGGSSTPSESDGRAVFENRLKQTLQNGTVKLVRFNKVNGQMGEETGIKFYKLQYEAEVEYPNGLNINCKDHVAGKRFSWDCYMKEVREKGERQVVKEEMIFEKTEKGWKAPDGHIY